MILHAQKQYQRLFENNPIDEDALCRLLGLLHRQGLLDDLRTAYEQAQKRFEQYEMRLSQTTVKLFEKLMQESPPLEVYLAPPVLWSRPKESEILWRPDPPLAQPLPITYNTSSQSSSLPRLELLEMLMMLRRKFLSDAIKFAGSPLILSPYASLPQESREHIERAMTHSSYVDNEVIDDLSAITQHYWNMRKKTAGIALLGAVTEHLTTITQFLKEARPMDIYKKLCALASENARLLGQIFHEIRECNLAWDSYAFALKMAHEIGDADLWGSVVARLAELLIYWGEPQEALPFLEEAQKRGIHDQRLRAQLASIEAEIYARAKDMDTCLRVLAESKKITLTASLADDRYRTGFTPSVAKGWEAACWIRLRKPEQALPILNESFATYNPASIRRYSYLLANSGWVHGQLGDVKNACKLLLESLNITSHTKSLIALQRVYQGRAELEPWKNSGEVKDLDAQIVQVYKNLAKVREWV